MSTTSLINLGILVLQMAIRAPDNRAVIQSPQRHHGRLEHNGSGCTTFHQLGTGGGIVQYLIWGWDPDKSCGNSKQSEKGNRPKNR